MMGAKATALRVGLLLVVGIAGAVGLLLFLSRGTVRDGLKFESYSRESVQGLDIGASVRFRGVPVGQVTEIALVNAVYPDTTAADLTDRSALLVVIRYTVDPKRAGRVQDPARAVEAGLRARLASQGITGVVYLELDVVDPRLFPAIAVSWTPRDQYLPSMPSTIARVQDAAEALAAKLQGVDVAGLATGLRTVLDDLHTQMTEGDAHAAFVEAQGLLRLLRHAVEQADLPALAADLQATSGSARALVESKQVHDMVGAAARAADRFAEASRRLPQLIAAMEAMVKRADAGVGDLQRDLDPMLRDARAAAANLREASETLRRYPSSILLGAPPPRDRAR